jgi:hypothetical protein
MECRIDRDLRSKLPRECQIPRRDIDCDNPCTDSAGNHDRRKPDTTATIDYDPLSSRNPSLIDYRAKRGSETTSQTGCDIEVQQIRQTNQIQICAMDGDILRKGSPVRKAWLILVLADLLIAAMALRAIAAPADKRNSDPITDPPVTNLITFRDNDARQLVPWDVRDPDVGIVANPAVPVASTDTRRHNSQYDTIRSRRWVWQVTEHRTHCKIFIENRFHRTTSSRESPGKTTSTPSS